MATKESTLFNNFQSKYLVRGMRFNPDVSERPELGLLAKQCLLELGAFGITDRYQDSLLLIEQALKLSSNSLKARSTNIAPNRTRGDRLPEEIQKKSARERATIKASTKRPGHFPNPGPRCRQELDRLGGSNIPPVAQPDSATAF